jgi:diacylglycerol O-acyltransferase / wax synthase
MEKHAETMSGIDSLMLALDHPGPSPVISGSFAFDSTLDFKRIEQVVKDRLLCHDRFTMRPTGKTGFATWETDKDMDLGYHLCRMQISYSGCKTRLRALFSELAAAPLDPLRPLWKIHYIEDVKEKKSFVFFRLHHCMGDGISLVRLLASITDDNAGTIDHRIDNTPPFPRPAGSGRRCRKACDFAAKKIKTIVEDPAHAAKCAKKVRIALSETAMTVARVLMLPPDRKHFFEKNPGTERLLAWSAPLPLDDIKKACVRFNATVNDIVVALTTAGLRRYLLQYGDLDDKPSIRMAVPVNIRLPEPESEGDVRLNNEFGFLLAHLPIYIKDPARRIHRVHGILEKLKQSSEAFSAWAGMNALGSAPAEVARKTALLFAKKITGIISNVPGPGKSLYFSGGRIINIMFWLPLIKGMGIGISAISYDNAISLGIVVDSRMVPDPEVIIGHIEEEFAVLLEECQNRKE